MERRIAAIELEKVTRLFGSTCALRAVTATFEAGGLSFLLGPNGAGKSTLLNIIGTVLSPTSGKVRYRPLGDDLALARAQIGWVAHESRCYRDLTGRQNLELAAKLYGLDPKLACARVEELVGLGRFAARSVGTLSRGQRQRVALARALIHQPSVLLLDEPWTGLDQASAERLDAVLRAEAERGTMVVVVTHSEAAARLGGRRFELRRGRLVSAGA